MKNSKTSEISRIEETLGKVNTSIAEINRISSILKRVKTITESIEAGVDYRLRWLTDRDFRTKTFEEKPECYMAIRTTYGNDLPLVPVCNRMGMEDPKLILGTLIVAKTFLGDERVEQDHLNQIIDRLSKMVGQDHQ